MTALEHAIANILMYRNLLQNQVAVVEAKLEAYREVKDHLPIDSARWHHADERAAYLHARLEAGALLKGEQP